MNCRTFETQVADWLSGRLPEAISTKMEAHRATCPACAQIARAESDLRRSWSELKTPSPTPDLWPQIAVRLDQPVRRQTPIESMRSLFVPAGGYRPLAAVACAVGIIVPVVICAGVFTRSNTQDGGPRPTAVAPVAGQSRPVVADTSFATTLIGQAGQADPSIDDPIGGTMEPVWNHVSTYHEDTETR